MGHPDARQAADSAASQVQRYLGVRGRTRELIEGLSDEDCQVQSMPDASPVRWHLAHVTWFFETMVLEAHERPFVPHHPSYRILFNSYYNGIGQAHPRAQRGLVTRPGMGDIRRYASAVDERVVALLTREVGHAELAAIVELGLQHEQQHQELILTDLLHLLSCNPLAPAYRAPQARERVSAPPALEAMGFDGGLVEIGHHGSGFAYDNECPRHRVWLDPFRLANRLVTQGEWAEFIQAGAYCDPRWWLSDGWNWVRQQQVVAPLYWRGDALEGWRVFTLRGEVPLDVDTPVTHVSFYEADAYARWRAAHDSRAWHLPTEAQWEHAAQCFAAKSLDAGNFVESGALHPLPARTGSDVMPLQLLGDGWEWTHSAYHPYPGYEPWSGAVGEYNGKFMVNQLVLRGGSCATPCSHIRTSYRNFFPAETRWQFSAVRLAAPG